MVPYILERMPRRPERYIEPFGGGGAVLFAKEPPPFEVYNDYNAQLTNMMWQIQNEPEYILTLLSGLRQKAKPNRIADKLRHLFLSSRDRFLINDAVFLAGGDYAKLHSLVTRLLVDAKTESQYVKSLRLVEKILYQHNQRMQSPELWDAVMFYERLRTSYAATGKSWCCTDSSCERFEQLIEQASWRLQHVAIENKDFRDVIRQYDRENAFIYCDPPYVHMEGMYSGIGEFGTAEHQALHDLALHTLGQCMISYNWCEYIEQTYVEDKFRFFRVERPHNLRHRFEKGARFPEVLIFNYDPEPYIYENNHHGQISLI